MQFLAEKRNRPTPNQPPSSALLSLAHHVPPSAHLYHGMMRSQLAAASSATMRSHMRLQCAPKAAVVLRQTVTLSRKPENLLGRYRRRHRSLFTACCAGRILDALQDIPSQRQPVAQMRKSPPHRRLSEDARYRTSTGTRESTRMTRNRPRPFPRMGAKFRKSATLGLTAVQ